MNSERPTHLTDQRFAELRALADSLGLAVTSRCSACGSPLWAAASLDAGIGPVCARKHTENDPSSSITVAKRSAATEAA